MNHTREDKIIEAMNAPVEIDLSIDVRIPRANCIKEEKKYKCTCCGHSWDTQKTHFSKSDSIVYQANDGHITICNSCRDKYYYKLLDLYSGNEEKAIEHMCREFGWVYHIEGLKAAKQKTLDRSRISHYISSKNLGQVASVGTTYIDSLKDYQINRNEEMLKSVVNSKEDLKTTNIAVTASAIDRWGVGFTEADYKNLDEHYKMLKKNNPNADNNQEIFIKSLCNLNMLMVRALQGGDSKEYSTLVEQYAKTFKQAGLRTIEEKDSSNDETFCMTLGFISEYTPEEFYLNKKLYEDMDNFGEYLERHVTRPMINLETGSETRDYEYFVPDEEDDYDE